MVVLADAVVDPGAVVVHLADAPLAHGAVVRALRLDAAALRALEDHLWRNVSVTVARLILFCFSLSHLSRFEPHRLNVFLRRVAPRDGSRVGEHSARVRCDGQP